MNLSSNTVVVSAASHGPPLLPASTAPKSGGGLGFGQSSGPGSQSAQGSISPISVMRDVSSTGTPFSGGPPDSSNNNRGSSASAYTATTLSPAYVLESSRGSSSGGYTATVVSPAYVSDAGLGFGVYDEELQEALFLGHKVDVEKPVQNTFIHYDVRNMCSMGSVPVHQQQWATSPPVIAENDFQTKAPIMEQAHVHDEELQEALFLGHKVDVERPVQNTFIHYDIRNMCSMGSMPVHQQQWATSPPAMAENDFHTKFPSMEQAHVRGECRPCAYHVYKPDGCRAGDDCSFCHLCTRGELKRRKRERTKELKGSSRKEEADDEKAEHS